MSHIATPDDHPPAARRGTPISQHLPNHGGEDENLALRPTVRITVSVPHPTGGGDHNPYVLLNETAHRLDGQALTDFDQSRTYNTYDGQNPATGPDWYAIEFDAPHVINCIEMTVGLPYRDGGWWTALGVEVSTDSGTWQTVNNLAITPPYNFDDERDDRRPYETYALTFDEICTKAVRVIGRPGGLAQFTSLARLGVYHRDFRRWDARQLPTPPAPRIFRLISSQTVWDLSENLAKLTRLTIGLPFMEYYLDEQRYQQHWQRVHRNYEGDPELWFMIGEALGWDVWNRRPFTVAGTQRDPSREPHVLLSFHGTLAAAVAPVVVEGQVLSKIESHTVVVKGQFDMDWHHRFAREHNLPWPAYLAAIERSPQLTLEQLEGAAALMGTIANTIANLVQHNLRLQHELDNVRSSVDQRVERRKALVREAMTFMQEHLETPVTVADVAHAMALGPSHFCSIFTEESGRTPSDYLIELRLERAKTYFAHTNMSVMEVCVALGYTPSYFSRLFKRRYGCTPGHFAQQVRGSRA